MVTVSIGSELPSFTFDVDRSQLRLFAKAIGETRPEYHDVEAARAAGYEDVLAPPTFLFTVGMNPADPFDFMPMMGVDIAEMLHGEQAFGFGTTLTAGRSVAVRRRVVDRYEKKGGALIFWVVETQFTDARDGCSFGMGTQTYVVRKG